MKKIFIKIIVLSVFISGIFNLAAMDSNCDCDDKSVTCFYSDSENNVFLGLENGQVFSSEIFHKNLGKKIESIFVSEKSSFVFVGLFNRLYIFNKKQYKNVCCFDSARQRLRILNEGDVFFPEFCYNGTIFLGFFNKITDNGGVHVLKFNF